MTVSQRRKLISIVVPVYNEAAGLRTFHESLARALKSVHKYDCEVIYCDDGSTDDTQLVIRELAGKDKRVRLLRLTRNFGKEMATTAGLRLARGEAVITIDGDGQHPAVLI